MGNIFYSKSLRYLWFILFWGVVVFLFLTRDSNKFSDEISQQDVSILYQTLFNGLKIGSPISDLVKLDIYTLDESFKKKDGTNVDIYLLNENIQEEIDKPERVVVQSDDGNIGKITCNWLHVDKSVNILKSLIQSEVIMLSTDKFSFSRHTVKFDNATVYIVYNIVPDMHILSFSSKVEIL